MIKNSFDIWTVLSLMVVKIMRLGNNNNNSATPVYSTAITLAMAMDMRMET